MSWTEPPPFDVGDMNVPFVLGALMGTLIREEQHLAELGITAEPEATESGDFAASILITYDGKRYRLAMTPMSSAVDDVKAIRDELR